MRFVLICGAVLCWNAYRVQGVKVEPVHPVVKHLLWNSPSIRPTLGAVGYLKPQAPCLYFFFTPSSMFFLSPFLIDAPNTAPNTSMRKVTLPVVFFSPPLLYFFSPQAPSLLSLPPSHELASKNGSRLMGDH